MLVPFTENMRYLIHPKNVEQVLKVSTAYSHTPSHLYLGHSDARTSQKRIMLLGAYLPSIIRPQNNHKAGTCGIQLEYRIQYSISIKISIAAPQLTRMVRLRHKFPPKGSILKIASNNMYLQQTAKVNVCRRQIVGYFTNVDQ